MPKQRNWIRLVEGEDGGSATPPVATGPGTNEQTPGNEQHKQQPKETETVDFWKTKAREQEKRAKSNAEAATELASIKEAQKTEAEKAAEKLRSETTRADGAEAELLRYQVAAEKDVPARAVRLLTGSTREEIEASAKEVLALIGEAGKPRTPKPHPAQREGEAPPDDKDTLARAFFGLSK